MVKYSKDVVNDSKVAKAGAMHIRVHYKHCREISQAIKGRTVAGAKAYLENVLPIQGRNPLHQVHRRNRQTLGCEEVQDAWG